MDNPLENDSLLSVVFFLIYSHHFVLLNPNTLRGRLRTHKVFTTDQCFYLNYHKFPIKLYVLAVY